VVIPCYGQAHFITDALESVFQQSWAAVDVVVVNDGAPDTALLEEVIAPYRDRIDYVRQENRGLSAARNVGLARTRGEFLIFLDADDRLLPNAIASGAEALRSHPHRGLVWGRRHVIDASGTRIRFDAGRISDTEEYIDLLRTNIVGAPVGVMWRRSTLQQVGGFAEDLRCGEDYDAYLAIAWVSEIHCHGETVADYRLHNANMSSDHRKMLAAVGEVYTRQAGRVGADRRMRRAVKAGWRDIHYRYVWLPLLGLLHRYTVERKVWRAALLSARLLIRYPLRFAPILLRHIPKATRLILRLRNASDIDQLETSSGITRPSTPVISTPSSAENVGARSSVETMRSS
jgi:glycosyltransferase involved in cell wall biosynthesis